MKNLRSSQQLVTQKNKEDEVRVASQEQTRGNGNNSSVGRIITELPVQGLETQLYINDRTYRCEVLELLVALGRCI